MKILTKTALAALIAGSIGSIALMPAFADDAAAPAPSTGTVAPVADEQLARANDMGGPGMMQRGPHGGVGQRGDLRANLLDLACGDRGGEALAIGLVHIEYAVKPTATQAPLLDALKTTALADQKTFADACKTAMGDAKADAGKPNLVDRLQARLAIDTAKVTALNDVLPKFKAFYDSLTDDQKTKLEPRRPMGERMGFNGQPGPRGWQHRMGPGHFRPTDGAGAPDQPGPGQADAQPGVDAPDAPDAAPQG
jgi:hypothetical protein